MSFISELKRPFNLVTLVLTILSIVLSFFFYYKAEKQKSISFSLNEPSSLIYDSKNSTSAIKIYEKDSVPINQDIFLLTGTIWNSGDFSILKSDLRIPISLSLNKQNRILDYKITKQSDSLITKFSLQKFLNNSLLLDWNYFDPKLGLNFQIIYVGVADAGFELNGKILDIHHFNKVSNKNATSSWVRYALLIVLFVYLIFNLFLLYKERNDGKVILWINIFQVTVALSGVIYLVWYLFLKNTPPTI